MFGPETPARLELGGKGHAMNEQLESRVREALHAIYDPEIPVDIVELGLIYAIAVDAQRRVKVTMTLTSPGCPVAGSLPGEVERAAAAVEGVSGAEVELVFDPPWTPGRMSEVARVALDF